MLTFTYRNAIEVALRVARIAEEQARGFAFADANGFDLGSLPILASKAYPGEQTPVPRIMVHVTGVTRGYGVQRWGPTGWRRWVGLAKNTQSLWRCAVEADGLVEPWDGLRNETLLPYELALQLAEADLLLTMSPDQLGRLVAQWSRFRNTPYHDIGTLGGYVLANRRHRQRSHHGNGTRGSGGNAGIGCAFDCSPNTDLSEFHIQTFQATLRASHLRLQRALAAASPDREAPRIGIVAHAQASDPARANDPGGKRAHIYRRVVVPVAETTPGLYLDPSWTYGTGRPIRASWS